MLLDLTGVTGDSAGGPNQRHLARAAILAGLLPNDFAAHFRSDGLAASSQHERYAQLLQKAVPDPYSKAVTLWLDLHEAQQLLQFLGQGTGDIAEFFSVVEDLWGKVLGGLSGNLRLAVIRAPEEVHPLELVALLMRADSRIRSVLFASRTPGDLDWNWPLRIGVPDTPAGKRLFDILGKGRYSDLVQLQTVNASSDKDGDCDLLLLPELLGGDRPLPFILEEAHTAAVVALEQPSPYIAEKLRSFADFALRHRRFGLTGIALVAESGWLSWFNTLVRELSHNATLDHAMFEARLAAQRQREGGTMRDADFAPPFLAGDPWFVEQARIAHTAQRIADAMLVVPLQGFSSANVARMGAQLANQASVARWISERGDARDLVQIRREAETVFGPLRPASIRAGDATPEFTAPAIGEEFDIQVAGDFDSASAGAPPPNVDLMVATAGTAPEVPPKETRRVQCTIFAGADGEAPVNRLKAKHHYRALVHIGAEMDEGALPADRPFDETQLPPFDHGHDLQVAFCPLDTRTRKDGIVPAIIRTIHLPTRGRSGDAEFGFDTDQDGQGFRARILILHCNRILQTILLAAPAPDANFVLHEETTVNPAFASSPSEATADIALVINDNPAGIPGILAVANGNASFSEPAGLNVVIETMESLLSKSNIETAGVALKLESKPLVGLMIQLANHGAALARELKRQMDLPDFESATRVQVVEARSKAYLPVEFVYTGAPPRIDATLCPNAKAALGADNNAAHANCKHAKDARHVCPAAFWGFSKCIERQPFGQSDQHLFSIPVPGADELAPFNVAVLAASSNVTPADLTGKDGVKPALAAVADEVRLARSWDDWKKDIETNPRATLLVLLPHSDNSPDIVNMPALEIQKKWLTSVELDAAYVQPPGGTGPGPVVLLLGCSTALADIPFLNFVREFKDAGASIVLGTLATVHGTHATRFVRSLLGKIKSSGKGRPFDEILLQVKCEMLAEGEPFVLSLAAYGHSSWRIHT